MTKRPNARVPAAQTTLTESQSAYHQPSTKTTIDTAPAPRDTGERDAPPSAGGAKAPTSTHQDD
jgi:hypothetical protein